MPAPILHDIATPRDEVLTFAAAVTAIGAIVVTPRGLVPGAGLLVIAPLIQAGNVKLTLSGGSDGERYDVVVNTTLLGGGAGVRDIVVAAIAPNWTMPDGSAGWLTLIEFIKKFGLDETVAATDNDGAGVIDRSYLIEALSDAQAECEGNIAGRYALPLSVVPGTLKTAVADLARVRLYPRGIPDGAETAAKAQRDNLKRIASGSMTLPGVAGIAVAEASATSDPIEFYSEGRTYPDGLADY